MMAHDRMVVRDGMVLSPVCPPRPDFPSLLLGMWSPAGGARDGTRISGGEAVSARSTEPGWQHYGGNGENRPRGPGRQRRPRRRRSRRERISITRGRSRAWCWETQVRRPRQGGGGQPAKEQGGALAPERLLLLAHGPAACGGRYPGSWLLSTPGCEGQEKKAAPPAGGRGGGRSWRGAGGRCS